MTEMIRNAMIFMWKAAGRQNGTGQGNGMLLPKGRGCGKVENRTNVL